jgi:hypothetical protein
MRAFGLLVLGLGLGLGAGFLAARSSDSPAVVWLAAGLVVAGLALVAASRGSAARPAPSENEKPALAGLGTRVEQILALAEDQAADRIRSAEQEAERIVAEAHRRAGQPPD